MRLGFFFRNLNTQWLATLVEELESHYAVNAAFGAIANAWTYTILHQGFHGRFEGFYYLLDFLQQNWDKFDISATNLQRIDRLYGQPNLWLDFMSSRYLWRSAYTDALKMIVGHIEFWEMFYEKTNLDVLVMDSNDMLMTMSAYRVAQQRGSKCLTWVNLPLTPRQIGFSHTADFKPDRMIKRFRQLQETGLSSVQRQRADTYIQTFREQALHPIWNQRHLRPELRPRVRLQNVTSFLRRFPAYFLQRDSMDYTDRGPIADAYQRLAFVGRSQLLKGHKLFAPPEIQERYIFYPLHFQPEATTLILAPFYVNQLYVIEQISRSLPLDTKLYVKEHPVSLGRRPISYYRQITQLPNVRLIETNLDSHQLIRNAVATLTLTGTVGWEAILYGLPAICLGNVFYDIYPLTKKITDITQLPYVLNQWLPTYEADEEQLLKFVTAVLEGSHPLLGYTDPHTEMPNDERIAAIAHAIAIEAGLVPKTPPSS